MNRHDLLCDAVDYCIKELYELAQPHIDWEEFKKECKQYSERYQTWENFRKAQTKKDEFPQEWEHQKIIHPDWENKDITKCIGPRPFEFYYLPNDIFKNVVDSYIHSYKMDDQQNLLDTIEVIKNYCKEPIVDKWIKGKNGFPGHRGYDHPDNLEKELEKILHNTSVARLIQEKFFEFLDMAGEFYDWNSELNSFSMSVYFGPTPNSNKEAVIKNWKEYRKQDIEIDEEQIKKEYYGEELD